MKKILVVFFGVLLLSLSVIGNGYDDLQGRDFVQLGNLEMISGELVYQFNEWFVFTNDGKEIEVHFGDHDYRAKNLNFEMKEGQEVRVFGYLYHDDMAVVMITLNDYSKLYKSFENNNLVLLKGLLNFDNYFSIITENEESYRIKTTTDLEDKIGEGVYLVGNLIENEIELISVTIDTYAYQTRTVEGRPLWAASFDREFLGNYLNMSEERKFLNMRRLNTSHVLDNWETKGDFGD